jgi:hypothetical protein
MAPRSKAWPCHKRTFHQQKARPWHVLVRGAKHPLQQGNYQRSHSLRCSSSRLCRAPVAWCVTSIGALFRTRPAKAKPNLLGQFSAKPGRQIYDGLIVAVRFARSVGVGVGALVYFREEGNFTKKKELRGCNWKDSTRNSTWTAGTWYVLNMRGRYTKLIVHLCHRKFRK